MYLSHESTILNENGVYEITVYVIGDAKTTKEVRIRKYTYLINSEFAARKFLTLYRKKSLHGHALALLNQFKIKEEKEK